jgi:hypothetical protein
MDKDFELEIQDENKLLEKKELAKLRADNLKAAGRAIAEIERTGYAYNTTAYDIARPFYEACKFTHEEVDHEKFIQWVQKAVRSYTVAGEEGKNRRVSYIGKDGKLANILSGNDMKAIKEIFDQHYQRITSEAIICKMCKKRMMELGDTNIMQVELNFEDEREAKAED